MAETDKTLDQKVIERLDKIDWDSLKKTTGITREQVEKFPAVASQLAYQQYTDLLFGSTADISGQFSLRAIPGKTPEEPWRVKAYTIEAEKSEKDDLFLYGSPIYSEAAKKALFEKTSWQNQNGEKVYGRANANAGRPVAIEREQENGEKKKEYYLISLHEPTNRIVGMPVEAIKRMLQNPDGTSRGQSVYGTKLTDDQVEKIVNGNAVKLDGKTKEGKEFTAFVQFDVARRQIVPCHPTWLKQAERAGVDIGIGKQQEQEKKKSTRKGAAPKQDSEKKGSKLKV